MADWHANCYQRAVAFVTDQRERVLVFDHLDVDAGTQLPAGGIQVGETSQEAVLRELAEESGLTDAVVVRKLGETWRRAEPGTVPAGLEEQVHHAFHLVLADQPAKETWVWDERSGGDLVEHRFAFRWVSLDEAAETLWPDQAMWLNALRVSLRYQ